MDFHTFIEDSADEWREQLRDTTNLSVMFLDRLPDCDIDAEKLKTALWQILKNAEDAGPDGAELSISVRLADTGRLETPAPPAPDSEGFVEVMIADRGSGMSEEVARHAFEPFFSEKNFAEKSGLGLSISFGIIKQHGGQIRMATSEGYGTEVTVVLPISPPPRQGGSMDSTSAEGPGIGEFGIENLLSGSRFYPK